MRLKVLTVNMHKGVGPWLRRPTLTGLRHALHASGADLACLQEVRGATAGSPPQHEAMADGLWPQHAYGRNAAGPTGEHGNAVLSRLPIAAVRNHDVSLPGDEPRGLLHCQLALPAGRAAPHVVCVHLGLRESHRRHQLARLAALVHTLPADAPLVVAGDFNDWRRRADGLLAGTGLTEVFLAGHGRHARSFPVQWPLLPLDRIYVRGVVAARPVPLPRRPWRSLSDHAPLAAELELPGGEP
ncbi:MAG: endonuclease/exonuclease/phosphatase family protein [Rubrivivax sp.]|nr:endonuclease/exonuclease/phosphatase family protein [Rubrivivax sp.]